MSDEARIYLWHFFHVLKFLQRNATTRQRLNRLTTLAGFTCCILHPLDSRCLCTLKPRVETAKLLKNIDMFSNCLPRTLIQFYGVRLSAVRKSQGHRQTHKMQWTGMLFKQLNLNHFMNSSEAPSQEWQPCTQTPWATIHCPYWIIYVWHFLARPAPPPRPPTSALNRNTLPNSISVASSLVTRSWTFLQLVWSSFLLLLDLCR